jgi:HSP20 family protein
LSGKKNNQWLKGAKSFMGSEFFQDFKDIILEDGPPVNLYESEHELLCVADLPAVQMNDVEVLVNTRSVSLKGDLRFPFQGYRLIQEEMFNGRFNKQIELPYPVASSPIQAFYNKGLLIIRLRRLHMEEAPAQKIQVYEVENP